MIENLESGRRGFVKLKMADLDSAMDIHSMGSVSVGRVAKGQASEGEDASVRENAVRPSKAAVAQRPSRSWFWIGAESLRLKRAAARERW